MCFCQINIKLASFYNNQTKLGCKMVIAHIPLRTPGESDCFDLDMWPKKFRNVGMLVATLESDSWKTIQRTNLQLIGDWNHETIV